MKTNEEYIRPMAVVVKVELETSVCLVASGNQGSLEDYDYEVYPEV